LAALDNERQMVEDGSHPLLLQMLQIVDDDFGARKSSTMLVFEARLEELDKQKDSDDLYAITQWKVGAPFSMAGPHLMLCVLGGQERVPVRDAAGGRGQNAEELL
jgi:hypothetical protein